MTLLLLPVSLVDRPGTVPLDESYVGRPFAPPRRTVVKAGALVVRFTPPRSTVVKTAVLVLFAAGAEAVLVTTAGVGAGAGVAAAAVGAIAAVGNGEVGLGAVGVMSTTAMVGLDVDSGKATEAFTGGQCVLYAAMGSSGQGKNDESSASYWHVLQAQHPPSKGVIAKRIRDRGVSRQPTGGATHRATGHLKSCSAAGVHRSQTASTDIEAVAGAVEVTAAGGGGSVAVAVGDIAVGVSGPSVVVVLASPASSSASDAVVTFSGGTAVVTVTPPTVVVVLPVVRAAGAAVLAGTGQVRLSPGHGPAPLTSSKRQRSQAQHESSGVTVYSIRSEGTTAQVPSQPAGVGHMAVGQRARSVSVGRHRAPGTRARAASGVSPRSAAGVGAVAVTLSVRSVFSLVSALSVALGAGGVPPGAVTTVLVSLSPLLLGAPAPAHAVRPGPERHRQATQTGSMPMQHITPPATGGLASARPPSATARTIPKSDVIVVKVGCGIGQIGTNGKHLGELFLA